MVFFFNLDDISRFKHSISVVEVSEDDCHSQQFVSPNCSTLGLLRTGLHASTTSTIRIVLKKTGSRVQIFRIKDMVVGWLTR